MITTLLLTTTVNVRSNISWLKQKDKLERKKMYKDIIKHWLKNTNFNIVVIENSGHKFENFKKNLKEYSHRFEIITYNYKKIPKSDLISLNQYVAKGQHELYAIKYACSKSKLISESDFVIKITGRYYVPDLEKIFKKYINISTDVIRQSEKMRKDTNRCEIIGCAVKHIDYLFCYPGDNNHSEAEYCTRIKNSKNIKNILNLPRMRLHKETTMGAGRLLKYL